jgi:hypothetical protein
MITFCFVRYWNELDAIPVIPNSKKKNSTESKYCCQSFSKIVAQNFLAFRVLKFQIVGWKNRVWASRGSLSTCITSWAFSNDAQYEL